MKGHNTVTSLKLAALGAVVVVAASFVVFPLRADAVAQYYLDTLTPTAFALWLAGLTMATLSPPTLAIIFWMNAKRVRHRWLVHILLIPVTFAIVRASIALMLFAAREPDSDGPTGWATDPATLLLLVCPVAYFLALLVTWFRREPVPADPG